MIKRERQRLGALVRARRRQLGLSIVAAARTAGVNRGTWEALENATRATRDHNYAGVERALCWWHGSVEAILNGGTPTPLPDSPPFVDPDVDPETGTRYVDPVEQELWRLDLLSPEDRRAVIAFVRTLRRNQLGTDRQRQIG